MRSAAIIEWEAHKEKGLIRPGPEVPGPAMLPERSMTSMTS